MSEPLPTRKLETANEMYDAIRRIVEMRAGAASQSQYDLGVCVRAVAAARDVIQDVPVQGTALEYGRAVVEALARILDSYHDPDGQYTSGKAVIGDVYYDVAHLVDTQSSSSLDENQTVH